MILGLETCDLVRYAVSRLHQTCASVAAVSVAIKNRAQVQGGA